MSAVAVAESGYRNPEAVLVSAHALKQMRDRFPEFKRANANVLSQMIRREVSEAFAAGRVSLRKPRWLLREKVIGGRSRANQGGRFAWPYQQNRAYVLRPYNDDGKRGWCVVTVMSSPR